MNLGDLPIIQGGATALLTLAVILVLTGRLTPRSQVEALRADKDAQIAMWRAVAETSQAQMGELLEHSRMTVQLLQAIEARTKGSQR
jgi:hypothetical protein